MKLGRLNTTCTPSLSSVREHGSEWTLKTWNGYASVQGNYIWSDGSKIYYSFSNNHYVLNGDTWEVKTWDGFTDVSGIHIWSDGTNIYYLGAFEERYVLNGDTWESKAWDSLPDASGDHVWTDGTTIYYSYGSDQYVLTGDTWEPKTWNKFTSVQGTHIWSDGTRIYNSWPGQQYVLNGDTWESKTWTGLTDPDGSDIWSDGINVYCSMGADQYVLNGDTWELKSWTGLAEFNGNIVWTDGIDIYCGTGDNQYVLAPAVLTPTFDLQSWLIGYALGLAGKPMPMIMRIPTAYLYNSLQLPALPKWNKEIYPHAYIKTLMRYDTHKYGYGLICASVPSYCDGVCQHPEGNYIVYRYDVTVGDEGWVLIKEAVYPWEDGNYPNIGTYKYDWCNTDIISVDDGTVHLAASDPIPIYD